MPYLGQCGRVAGWDYSEGVMVAATAYFIPKLGSDADWREHDREMGEIGEFREVRVVGIAEEEKRRQGQLHKALWVLVVTTITRSQTGATHMTLLIEIGRQNLTSTQRWHKEAPLQEEMMIGNILEILLSRCLQALALGISM